MCEWFCEVGHRLDDCLWVGVCMYGVSLSMCMVSGNSYLSVLIRFGYHEELKRITDFHVCFILFFQIAMLYAIIVVPSLQTVHANVRVVGMAATVTVSLYIKVSNNKYNASFQFL